MLSGEVGGGIHSGRYGRGLMGFPRIGSCPSRRFFFVFFSMFNAAVAGGRYPVVVDATLRI